MHKLNHQPPKTTPIPNKAHTGMHKTHTASNLVCTLHRLLVMPNKKKNKIEKYTTQLKK